MESTENDNACFATQLVDGDGSFNVTGIERFTKKIRLAECGQSYAVVSIIGLQSSGKSTLLNHLFGTNFREMDPLEESTETTKGIWLARCNGIEPCTLVMDLEGTDGGERKEDDTAFERQSALFALAMSDIVLINMWCHDIGRYQAANIPLLTTVFEVMMRLFSPRKATLMFVLRDKTIMPLEILERIMRKFILKIWDSICKPEAHKETPLSKFFNVEVVALSSYEDQEELFKEQVASLRQRFFHSIAPGGLAGDCHRAVPASGFSFGAQQIWRVVKENKDLELPAHKVMVATIRCEEIANEIYNKFTQNQEWLQLEEASHNRTVAGFGKILTSILGKCLSEYDAKAAFFDEGVRNGKKRRLEDKLLQLVLPAFNDIMDHLRSDTLDKFKEAFEKALNGGEGLSAAANRHKERYLEYFDRGCEDAMFEQAKWVTFKVRSKIVRDIDEYVAPIRTSKLAELVSSFEFLHRSSQKITKRRPRRMENDVVSSYI